MTRPKGPGSNCRRRSEELRSEKSQVRDGMRIDWDVPIKMHDGLVLRGWDYESQKSTGASLFGGRTTLRLGDSCLLLPVIP